MFVCSTVSVSRHLESRTSRRQTRFFWRWRKWRMEGKKWIDPWGFPPSLTRPEANWPESRVAFPSFGSRHYDRLAREPVDQWECESMPEWPTGTASNGVLYLPSFLPSFGLISDGPLRTVVDKTRWELDKGVRGCTKYAISVNSWCFAFILKKFSAILVYLRIKRLSLSHGISSVDLEDAFPKIECW